MTEIAFVPVDDCFWHIPEVPARLAYVSYWGYSGKHMLDLRFTAFDPQETCAAIDCCYANRPLSPFRWAQIPDWIAFVASLC